MKAAHSRFPLLWPTLRRLAQERGFTAVALATLALCIGANVAIFAVVDAALLRPLPFPESERLVVMRNAYPNAGVGAGRGSSSLTNYYERRGQIDAFESIAIHQRGSAIIGEAGSPYRAPRDRVSPEFFETLGVPLAQGRAFTDDDMVYSNAQILVLTHEFWQSYFDGDPDIIGRSVMVDSLPNTVVGVLPPGFRFLDSRASFFIPLASNLEDRGADRRHSNGVDLIGRLAPGATVEAAQREIDAFNDARMADDPYATLVRDAGFRSHVYSLHGDVVREAKPVLLTLQAGAALLLVIGGVNLVNLLLIRASGRLKETAVRQALGADRQRLAHETILETVLLAVGGGAIGLAVGAAGIRLLQALGADQLPIGMDIGFDSRVALLSIAGSLAVGLLLAAPIVAFNLRRDLTPALKAESRGGTASRAAQEARYAFVVAQIALAFVLLAGAGLLGASLRKALAESPGFRPDSVLTAHVSLPWKNYPEAAPRQAFFERLVEAMGQMPGVTAAGLCSGMPFSGSASDNATVVEGVQLAPGESLRTHYTSFAIGDYWQAMGIPLIEGRFLEAADNHSDARVCVVDQAFADRYWPGESALGRRIASDVALTDENALTIVGVVGAVKQRDLAEDQPLGAVYMPYKLRSGNSASIALRAEMEPSSLINALRQLVLSLDPELPIDEAKALQERIDDSLVARRSPALLTVVFACVALLLAAIGTYGALAYAVAQQRREIGVRIAIGALPSQVLRQYMGLGAKLLAAGLGIGALGAWAAGRAMQGLLFHTAPLHLGIFAATGAVLVVTVLAATALPSQRAARVAPVEAMSED